MIPAARHIYLMLTLPVHSVTCFELPVYRPSEAERRDPKLYAHNVRQLMVRRGEEGEAVSRQGAAKLRLWATACAGDSF
jgi:lysophosphatidylcholine acyltransferase/lyso-PAF acetyltransferase